MGRGPHRARHQAARAGRRLAGAFLALVLPSAFPLGAQTSIHAALGARYSSLLVHDSIVTTVDVRPELAPAFTGSLALPLDSPWRLELVADVATSPVKSHDASGAAQAITRVWTLGVSVGLGRRLTTWLEGRATVGGLKYFPAATIGLFRNGGGELAPYGSLAFDALPGALARRGVALEVTGDVHRFLTPALRSAGFVDSRVVYRVTLGARATLWGAR